MKLNEKAVGFKDLDKNLKLLVQEIVHPQSGISDMMDKAAWIIVREVQKNIYRNFNTSGDFPSRVGTRKINQYQVNIVVNAVYAAIQEYGGTIEVTEKARGYFWYRFYASGKTDTMWKALALSQDFTIPARPYLRPALAKKTPKVYKRLAKLLCRKIRKHKAK